MSVKLVRMSAAHTNEAFEFDDDAKGSSTIPAKDSTKDKNPPELPPVSFLALFRFASFTDRLLLVAAVLSSAINGICFPFLVILIGDLTNSFISGGIDQSILDAAYCNASALPPGFNDTWLLPDLDVVTEQFTRFGINVSIIAVVLFILGFVFVSALNFTAENQVYRMRSRFFEAIIRQDIAWYDTKISNDFASRITEDLIKVQDGIGDKIGLFILSATNFVAAITNAFIHGWELTLVMLAATPVLFISMSIVAKVQTSLTEHELKAYAESGGVAEEVLSSIRTVVAFGGQEKEAERYEKNLVLARKAGMKRGLATGIGNGLVWGIIYANYALAFWYGLTLILDSCGKADAYTASDLLVVFFSVLLATMQIGRVSPYIESFSIARGSAASIFDIIDRVPVIDSSSTTGDRPLSVEGRIIFDQVRFNYPSRPQVKILRGLSLTVEPGQTVALVGASGCGKSTCIQLLQRFYDPLEGRVTIDGHDVKDLNLGWLRGQMGIVSQEPCLFGVTIGENIRYGRDGVTQDEVEKAAREANAHDFIMRLPLRYDTKVGERGAQLSGGQKQRIAIARALVRNPKILLLDEATSALDTRSESVVQTALDKARRGRTTIIVAHRLSTIRNADRILVLKEGVVEEEGTHDTLMEKQGVYYKLVSQQGNEKKIPSAPLSDEEDDDEDSEPETNVEEKVDLKRSSIASVSSKGSSSFADDSSSQFSASTRDDVELSEIMQMNRPEWNYITLGVIGSALVGLSAPAYAIIFGNVLGVLRPAATEEEQAAQREQGNFYSLMFLVLGIVVGFAAFSQSFSFAVAGERLTSRLRGLTFRAILKQEIGWFDRETNSVGSLCARLSSDASAVQGSTGSRIGVLFQAISTMASSIILSLYYEWKLGLTAMTFVPLLLVSYYLQARVIMGQTAMELDGLQKSSRVALEAIGNIRTVAGLGREKQFHELYMGSLRGPHRAALKKAWIRGIIFGASTSLPMFAYAATMYYGGWLVANEGLDFEKVFKVSQSLLFGTEMVAQAAAYAPSYNRAKVAAGRIFSLLGRVPQIDDKGSSLSQVTGQVDFDSVKFRYPTRRNIQVLRGLSLSVRAGQTVALVGHSGCGKSTCIQLLERFYDPDAGKVDLDEQNIRPVSVGDLRSHLGLVSQEPVLFNRTIGENIAYGDNYRVVPVNEIIEAARKANIHTFIQSLPSGYETMVGERGTQLSGGQKQRVAIARALLRNPKILLLDEATSALDSESEKVVQAALDAAREGRTCITIAHRLSTIRNADNIVVMDRGRIQEQGTHDELICSKGLYYELCSIQGIFNSESDEQSKLKTL